MGADSLMNLHTHTVFSDGDFLPELVVGEALKGGLSHIAISDHFETLKVRSLRSKDLQEYIALIRSLGRKFDGGIDVLVGVEIDTGPARCDLHDLPFDQLHQLDFVLFEYVSDPLWGGTDLLDLEEIRSQLSIPCGLAHTDISRVFADYRPDDLTELLRSMDLFVEVNTAHPYRREELFFFELAIEYYQNFKGKVKVSVGTDAHHTLAEVTNVDRAYRFVKRAGLEDQTVF